MIPKKGRTREEVKRERETGNRKDTLSSWALYGKLGCISQDLLRSLMKYVAELLSQGTNDSHYQFPFPIGQECPHRCKLSSTLGLMSKNSLRTESKRHGLSSNKHARSHLTLSWNGKHSWSEKWRQRI